MIVSRIDRLGEEAKQTLKVASEHEVFLHVVSAKRNKQIAARLGVGLKTIKTHRGRMMQKMQTKTLADLVRSAEKVGIANAVASNGLSGQMRAVEVLSFDLSSRDLYGEMESRSAIGLILGPDGALM